jgi:RNA polymerase sigma factor (sigma-70 family)
MAVRLTPEQAKLAQEYLSLTLWLVGKFYKKYKYYGYDAVYDAAITALIKSARGYDETKGANFKTFLAYVTENEMVRIAVRANAKKRTANVVSFDAPVEEDLTLLDMVGTEDTYRIFMNDAAVELTEREKEAIYMKYVEGKNQTEIGEHFGISQVHASRIIRKGLKKMRERV